MTFIFSSPLTYRDDFAWNVRSNGDVNGYDYVDNSSYGRESPGTTGSVDIWHLYPDGGVDNFGNVSFSYGHLIR